MQFNEGKQWHKRFRWHVYQIFELNKLKCEITKMTVQATKTKKQKKKKTKPNKKLKQKDTKNACNSSACCTV